MLTGPTPPRRAALALLVTGLGVLVTGCGDDGPASAATDGGPPAKVTVAGDSISVGLGTQLRQAADPDTTVKVIGEVGTGLARPDNFDWPARLQELARDFPPDVLVFSVGSNDAQDLTDAGGDVEVTRSEGQAWEREYADRLAQVFDTFENTGTRVVWVGHVRTEEDRVGDANRQIHRIATEVAAERPWVTVADLADLLGTGDRVASDCLLPDGLHLTVDCLRVAAEGLVSTTPVG